MNPSALCMSLSRPTRGSKAGQALVEFLIVLPVLVLLIFGIIEMGAAWRTYQVATNTAREGARLTILPFVNMSGDPDNEYLSDGITEELLNALAQLPGLRVPGRTSSFAFKGQNLTIQQIADTLNVAHVLEGSVRRSGETVLITAQLVDAQSDTHLWSDTFERELEDIFAIQREIALAIVDEAYLRGRYFLNQRTSQSIRSANTEFQQAVDLDPQYAEVYSGLADSYLLLTNYGFLSRTNLEQGLIAA